MGYFVGEDRNVRTKSVSFFSVGQDSGQEVWHHHPSAQSWWIGLEAVHRDVVLLHEYASPDLPDHKKIHALDLQTGRPLWSNIEMRFVLACDQSVIGGSDTFDRRLYYELDLHSGNVQGEVSLDRVSELRNSARIRNNEIAEFPAQISLPDVTEAGISIGHFFQSTRGGWNEIRQTEYMERENILIIGYYEDKSSNRDGSLLEHHLALVDRGRNEVVFVDRLETNVAQAVPDSFFSIGSMLYYVKDKKQLKAIRVNSGR